MKKILIIEDDLDIAQIVEMALEDSYEVQFETDTQNILAIFDAFKPDMVMIDNQLGQKQAADVIAEIKKVSDYKTIPFVLFSGHHDIKRIAAKINAAAYLSKPFALTDLYACVEDVLTQCV